VGVWYVDSVSYAAITAWATGATIAAGALRRPSAPSLNNERVVVCIVAGTTHATTEPTWTTTKGAKNTDNTVTWQECTGQPGVCGDLTNCPNWTSIKNTNPGLGKVIQNNAGTFLFICSTAGTAGNGSEPSWGTTAGNTTADNAATWTCIGAVANFTAFKAAHARLVPAFTANWGAAGDTFYVGDDHAETQSTSQLTLGPPSSATSQCQILCCDHTKSPPAAADLKTTATVTTTGNNNFTIQNGSYWYGITFQCGSGANAALMSITPNTFTMIFDSCSIQKLGTSASTIAISFNNNGGSSSGHIKLRNTTVKFGATGDAIRCFGGRTEWIDTPSAIAGATLPTNIFAAATTGGGVLRCEGVDFSALGSATIFGTLSTAANYTFIGCKFGSSFVVAGALGSGTVVDFINCDSGSAYNSHSRNTQEGAHTIAINPVRTGGASDGTAISWSITTRTNASPVFPFFCMPIMIWNAVTGTNRTVTVAGIWNAAALPNNDDIWLEAEYFGSSSTPITSRKTQTKATVLSSNAALPADSTSAWDSAATARANTTAYSVGNIIKLASNPGRIFFCTTAGTSAGSEPGGYSSAVDGGSVTDSGAVFRAGVRFSLTVTLSSPQPQKAGYIKAYVMVGKASASSIWIDPLITLG